MTLDAHIPAGPLEKKWTTYRNNAKIISPANKRKYKLIIVGSGLAGASAAATLGEQGFNIECFCYQDSRASRALDRRAGRNQRREKLSKRRRQRLSSFLRHHQGRRFSRARSKCLPACRSQRADHRPMRRAGSSFRARIWRAPCKPLLWRRAGFANLLCSRSDRPAASPRHLPGFVRADCRGPGQDVSPHGNARSRAGRRARQRHRRPGHGDRRNSQPCG